MEFIQDLFALLGRVSVASMFLWVSYEMLRNWKATMNYLKDKGIPKINVVGPAILAVRIIGGLTIFLGWHAHFGALILLVLTIGSLVYLHPFWKIHGVEGTIEKAFFMKELTTVGALFLVLALGAGQWALGGV